ncbi:hypothetical protein LCGC14_2496340, partial [marine sediment metagenome]
SAWMELSKKYGRLPFKTLFEPAIEYASKGFLVSPITAKAWEYAPDVYRNFPDFNKEFLDFYFEIPLFHKSSTYL